MCAEEVSRWRLAALGHACAAGGNKEEAREVLHELIQRAKESYVSPYDIALVHAGLGEKDLAFDWLEKAFAERSVWMVRLRVDLRLEDIHEDSRFIDLTKRVGVPFDFLAG